MVKFYAIALGMGVFGLIVLIYGGTLAENLGRPEKDPGLRIGLRGKQAVGGLLGFGMGGLSSEYSPLDLSWQVSLMIAVAAAVIGVLWVWFAVNRLER